MARFSITNAAFEALAYRIWAVGRAHDWDLTWLDIAAELNVSRRAVARVVQAKGWQGRTRRAAAEKTNEYRQAQRGCREGTVDLVDMFRGAA